MFSQPENQLPMSMCVIGKSAKKKKKKKGGQAQHQAMYVKVQHEQRQWFLRNCVWVDSSFLNVMLAKGKKS